MSSFNYIKLRLPICEMWCDIFQLFRSLILFYRWSMYQTFRTASKIK